MQLKGNLFVAGKVGPFDVATEEAVRALHEKLEKTLETGAGGEGPVVPLQVGDELVVAVCTSAELAEIAPGRWCVRVEVDVDDDAIAAATPPPPHVPTPDESAEIERRLEDVGL